MTGHRDAEIKLEVSKCFYQAMSSSQVIPELQNISSSCSNSSFLYISTNFVKLFFCPEKCDLRNITVLFNLPGQLLKQIKNLTGLYNSGSHCGPAREDKFRMHSTQTGPMNKTGKADKYVIFSSSAIL